MQLKVCSTCKIEKLLVCFSRNVSKKSGYSSECKECHRISRKSYYERNASKEKERVLTRKKLLKSYYTSLKSDLKCYLCSENHPATLQFHHLDTSKKEINIGHALHLGWSIKRIQIEIDKCIVLCSNCHFKEHYEMSKGHTLVSELCPTYDIQSISNL